MHPFQQHFLEQQTSSDKISHHGYQRIYPWFLGHFIDQEVDLLEIGVDKTESLKLWKGYFKKVHLCGIDKDEKYFADKDVSIYKVDQGNRNELREFGKAIGKTFDIIIDDGSHVPSHQILTLVELWSVLRPGGVYIIEDIETSYWKKSEIYGYPFDSRKTNFVSFACQLIDDVNSEFQIPGTTTDPQSFPLTNDVEIVAFAYNCIVLIKKDPASFGAYYNRPYRFRSRINARSLQSRIKRGLIKLLTRR